MCYLVIICFLSVLVGGLGLGFGGFGLGGQPTQADRNPFSTSSAGQTSSTGIDYSEPLYFYSLDTPIFNCYGSFILASPKLSTGFMTTSHDHVLIEDSC